MIMGACEKCWADAYLRAMNTGKSQTECYHELLEERKEHPCSVEEQSGKDLYFWNKLQLIKDET